MRLIKVIEEQGFQTVEKRTRIAIQDASGTRVGKIQKGKFQVTVGARTQGAYADIDHAQVLALVRRHHRSAEEVASTAGHRSDVFVGFDIDECTEQALLAFLKDFKKLLGV